jgi:hypothetical protein
MRTGGGAFTGGYRAGQFMSDTSCHADPYGMARTEHIRHALPIQSPSLKLLLDGRDKVVGF